MHKSAPKNKISHLCNVKCVTIPQMVNDQPSNACEANHHTGGTGTVRCTCVSCGAHMYLCLIGLDKIKFEVR
jgi:hypothetical protein